MVDPVAGDAAYAAHKLGVVGISLSWLPKLADFFSSCDPDADGSPPELPAPVVLDLSGDWGHGGLKGADFNLKTFPCLRPGAPPSLTSLPPLPSSLPAG